MKEEPIEQLADDPRNPRIIGEKALTGLRHSLEDFGDLSGIVFNQRSGHLVAGHQRMRVLREAGATAWVRTGEDAGYIEHPGTGERFGKQIVLYFAADEFNAIVDRMEKVMKDFNVQSHTEAFLALVKEHEDAHGSAAATGA
jgi:hypothetical protein